MTIAAATAQSAIWPSELEAVGTIRAARGVELSAETSGEVIEIAVTSGEKVTAGQPILTLNNRIEAAGRSQREANLKLARQLHERDARLIKQKTIPQSQYDRSKAELDAAIAALAQTSAQLDNKRIVAPFDGIVEEIKRKQDEWVAPGDPILHLLRLDTVHIDGAINQKQYDPHEIQGCQVTVEVELARGRKETIPGRITKVSSIVRSDGVYNVRAEVANREEQGSWVMRDGLRANMTIHLGTGGLDASNVSRAEGR